MKKRTKSFELGSYKFTIKYVKTVKDPDTNEDILGLCDYLDSTIYVATEFKGQKLNEDSILHNAWHEKAHAIMGIMGKQDLNRDEVFIDHLGLCLAQMYKTSK